MVLGMSVGMAVKYSVVSWTKGSMKHLDFMDNGLTEYVCMHMHIFILLRTIYITYIKSRYV